MKTYKDGLDRAIEIVEEWMESHGKYRPSLIGPLKRERDAHEPSPAEDSMGGWMRWREKFEQCQKERDEFESELDDARNGGCINVGCGDLRSQLATCRAQLSEAQMESSFQSQTCEVCLWSTTSLNVGDAGKSFWMCHGCLKRAVDELATLKSELSVSQQLRAEWKANLDACRVQLEKAQKERDDLKSYLKSSFADLSDRYLRQTEELERIDAGKTSPWIAAPTIPTEHDAAEDGFEKWFASTDKWGKHAKETARAAWTAALIAATERAERWRECAKGLGEAFKKFDPECYTSRVNRSRALATYYKLSAEEKP